MIAQQGDLSLVGHQGFEKTVPVLQAQVPDVVGDSETDAGREPSFSANVRSQRQTRDWRSA